MNQAGKASLPALALLLACLAAALRGEEVSAYGNPFIWMTVGQAAVKAEVVRTPEKLYQGLSHRPDLPEGMGMLFVMPRREVQEFSMRGMEFPLDFLWLVPGRVLGVEKNVPATYPGTLTSPGPASHVLEVPAGFCDRYGIKAGDPARWQ
jgi:hypothetical protein